MSSFDISNALLIELSLFHYRRKCAEIQLDRLYCVKLEKKYCGTNSQVVWERV